MSHPADPLDLDALESDARACQWGLVRERAAALGELPPGAALLAAQAELRLGLFAEALSRLEALERKLAPQSPRWAGTRNLTGVALCELGQLELAEQALSDALELAIRDDDHVTAARATNNLGVLAAQRGRHDEALSRYRMAIPAYQRLGLLRGLGETHHNLAITLRDLARFDEAEREERRAIAFAEESGSTRLLALARAGRAEISLQRGELEVAAAGARIALAVYRGLEDPVGEADALRLSGAVATALGSLEEAEADIGRALALAERHGSAFTRAEALRARASLHLARRDRQAARDDVLAAGLIFDQLGAEAERRSLDQWWATAL